MNLRSHLFWLVPLMVGGLLSAFCANGLNQLNGDIQEKTLALTKKKNDLSARLAKLRAEKKEAEALSQKMDKTTAALSLSALSVNDFDLEFKKTVALFGLPDLRLSYSIPEIIRDSRPDVFSTKLEKYNLTVTGTVIDDRPLFAFLAYLVHNAPMKIWVEKLQLKRNKASLTVTVNLVWLTNTALERTDPFPLQEGTIEKWPEQPSLFQSPAELQESYKAQLYTTHKKVKLSAILYRAPTDWTVWLDSKKFTDDAPRVDDISIQEVTPDGIRFDIALPFFRIRKNLRLQPNQTYYPECNCLRNGTETPFLIGLP